MTQIADADSIVGSHPDAEILMLGKRLIENHARYTHLGEVHADKLTDPPEVEREVAFLVAEYHFLRGELGELAAETPDGVRIKAQVAMMGFHFNPSGGVDASDDTFVAWSLCRDILRLDA